jgi:hypothetical protein
VEEKLEREQEVMTPAKAFHWDQPSIVIGTATTIDCSNPTKLI